MAKIAEAHKVIAYYLTYPAAHLLARTSISPNTITWLGFLITLSAASLIATGYLLAAGWVVLIAGFFDILDGALARHTNKVTSFGAFLDSTLDRLSEIVILLGILLLSLQQQQAGLIILLTYLAMIGSFLVSYTRARAEALGIACEVGFFTRAERVVILSLGLLLSHINYALIVALALIALFSFITTGQRIVYSWRQTKKR